MRGLERFAIFLFLLLVIAASAFIVMNAATGQQVGPAVALCPGPDEYGYVCADQASFQYVDASNDTELYADDGLVQIELPFTFTFYGRDYDAVWASSNGNLQFTTENAEFVNDCLAPEPAADMGDMIAPYWDDLSLTFVGFLQTEVVGQAPERVFVIEWDDILKFGTVDDQVTFEVQLFEGSNDIVFLYEDAQTIAGGAGSEATIGLQSEQQVYALQASCNQYAVFDGSLIHFVHPDTVATEAAAASASGLGRPGGGAPYVEKGLTAWLMDSLRRDGRPGLIGLQRTLLNERPRLDSAWRWADMDGDGEAELVILWRGDVSRPELVEVAIAGVDDDDSWQLRWQAWPLARQDRLRSLGIVAQGDVTGDGSQEVILRDPVGGAALALTRTANAFELLDLPGRCAGPLVLRDVDADGAQEIFVGGCPGGGRLPIQWDGQSFSIFDED